MWSELRRLLPFVLLLSLSAFGQSRESLVKPGVPVMDLTRESRHLSLQAETSVQDLPGETQYAISILGGTWTPRSVVITSREKVARYDFQKSVPMLFVNFETYPLRFYGRWGLSVGGAYGYKEQRVGPATSLHFLVGQAALAYRLDLRDRQWLIPFAKFGYNAVGLVQRGLEDYNTSEKGQFTSFTLGADLQLNRLRWFHSRSQTSVVMQYQRSSGSAPPAQNWTGDSYALGVSLAL